MNNLVEKRIVACYQVVDNAIKSLGLSIEDAINTFGPVYYDTLELVDRNTITYDDFKNKVREFTIKKDPPKPIKELYIDPWLDPVWRSNEKTNWNNYKWALEAEGKEKLVSQLDADTFAILDCCYNPKTDGQWERRGLVYGHVQSGKTANYIGLANKAFDVGYKIVIIFTGMTEDLRKQTQDRVNSGIVGTNEHSEKYGVGLHPTHKPDSIKGATHLRFDLNSNNVETVIANLSLDQNIVFVVKKNVAVLNSLIKWLNKKRIAQNPDQEKIINTPFLILDDEADNASIQSLSKKDYQLEQDALAIRALKEIEKKDEDDLTAAELDILEKAKNKTIKAINRNIRICLSLIAQKSFVAYTATPYSVIAQRSESNETDYTIEGITYKIDPNSDLFPEHFIIPLDPSPKYMGIEKIFGSERKEALPVISTVSKEDKLYFPVGNNSIYSFESIPESLEDAIIHFVVAIFVRESRKQKQHNTMLVHSSHKVDKIDYLADKIDKYLGILKDKIKTNPNIKSKFNKELELIRGNSKNKLFEEHLELDLEKYSVPKEISSSDIYSIIDKIILISYHSKERDPELKHHTHDLIYPNLERDPDKTRIFIVVGGNRISRGFTLEGLSTSYFVREAGTQDTLYQMGRWFGFRIGYEDTVRIYLPKEQIAWFRDILNLELELRDDLALMNSDRQMTPSMWEIKMVNSKLFESLNKKLKLCDENKLRHTKKKKLSFGGTNQFTQHFKRNNKLQESNLNLTRQFVAHLAEGNSFKTNLLYKSDSSIYFNKILVSEVLSFLSKYQFHQKDEILYSVQSFLSLNSNLFDSFSVVVKQNLYKAKNEVKPVWQIIDKAKNIKDNVTGLIRGDRDAEKRNSEYYFNDNLLDADKDNTFDILDTETKVDEYINLKGLSKSDYLYKLRNESRKALLIIYIIKGEMEIGKGEIFFPSLYLSIPNVGEPVTYTVRNR